MERDSQFNELIEAVQAATLTIRQAEASGNIQQLYEAQRVLALAQERLAHAQESLGENEQNEEETQQSEAVQQQLVDRSWTER